MDMGIYFINSDYMGLSFSTMFVFVTLRKDSVNLLSYTITEYSFGAANLCEYHMLFFW